MNKKIKLEKTQEVDRDHATGVTLNRIHRSSWSVRNLKFKEAAVLY